MTGWWLLDPLCALLVGLHLLWVGVRVMREAAGGLMDEALPAADQRRIHALVAEQMEGALQAHQFLTRRAAERVFIEFHLVVPGELSVARSHAICDRIEDRLRAEYPQAHISIHVEPEGEALPGAEVDGRGD